MTNKTLAEDGGLQGIAGPRGGHRATGTDEMGAITKLALVLVAAASLNLWLDVSFGPGADSPEADSAALVVAATAVPD